MIAYRFWLAFLLAALVTLALLGGVGWIVGTSFSRPPPAKFVSSAFEFELPKGWECQEEGSETVCGLKEKPTPAICILTMKYRGPEDTHVAYAKHLSRPQVRQDSGQAFQSEVKYVTQRGVGGYVWTEGLHHGSEVRNYFTHYLATVTSHVAILVTFSAHQDHYGRFTNDLETMISTLKIYQGRSW